MILSIASPLIISIIVLSIIGLVVLLSYTFFKKKTDIIDTYELYLKMGLALYAHIIYTLFLCIHSVYILIRSGEKGEPFIELSIVILAIFPTIYLVYSYFNLNRHIRKRLKLTEPETGRLNKETILHIEKTSERLELKNMPTILLSSFKNTPPCVFGKSSKKSYISLPYNWDEMFGKISRNNPIAEKNLKCFVLNHELSHIKHKDHIFIGASYFFLKALKYWTLSAILAAAMLSIIKGLSQVVFSFFPIFWGMIFYAIIYFLTMSVSRNRELIADARASLFMSEKELESISARNVKFKTSKNSYLELLNQFFSTEAVSKTNIVGISGSRTNLDRSFRILSKVLSKKIIELIHGVISTHPVEEERLKKLKGKYFVKSTHTIVSRGLCIWIGIVLAFFLLSTFLYKSDVSNLLIEPINIQSKKVSLGGFFLIFIILFVPVSLYVPLRNSVTSLSSLKMYLVALLNRYLIVYFSFCITFIFLVSINRVFRSDSGFDLRLFLLDLVIGAFIRFFLLFLIGFLISTLCGFLHFHTIPYLYNLASLLEKNIFVSHLLKLSSIGLFVLLLNFLGIKIIPIIIGVSMGITVSIYQEMKFPIITDHLSKWEVIGNQKFIWKSDLEGIIGFSFWIFLLNFFLPMAILGIILNSIESIKVQGILFLGNIGVVIYLITKNMKKVLPPYSGTQIFLGSINCYLFILKTFNIQKIQKEKEIIFRIIEDYKLENYSYPLHKKINLGAVDSSFHAVSSLFQLQRNLVQEKTAGWFLSLENDEGGFAPIAGLKSRLSSTYQVLYILNIFNLIQKSNANMHSTWIRSLQKEEGYFSDSISKFSEIQQTFFALHSLHLLGSMGMINGKKCIEWVKKTWEKERSRNDITSAFYAINCLELLGVLPEDLKREIKDRWLYPNSVMLKNLQVDNHLELFYYFFKIAEIIIDEEEEIKNLVPSLGENIYDSFLKYLKKMTKVYI